MSGKSSRYTKSSPVFYGKSMQMSFPLPSVIASGKQLPEAVDVLHYDVLRLGVRMPGLKLLHLGLLCSES